MAGHVPFEQVLSSERSWTLLAIDERGNFAPMYSLFVANVSYPEVVRFTAKLAFERFRVEHLLDVLMQHVLITELYVTAHYVGLAMSCLHMATKRNETFKFHRTFFTFVRFVLFDKIILLLSLLVQQFYSLSDHLPFSYCFTFAISFH